MIDWLLVLSQELAIEFRRELHQFEEEKAMPYITSIERLGCQEGLEQGPAEPAVALAPTSQRPFESWTRISDF